MSGRVVVADMPSPLLVSRAEFASSNGNVLTGSTTSIAVDRSDAKLPCIPAAFEFLEICEQFVALPRDICCTI